jgi:hypothetical protein
MTITVALGITLVMKLSESRETNGEEEVRDRLCSIWLGGDTTTKKKPKDDQHQCGMQALISPM